MIKEISFCVNKLVEELGMDYCSKGKWETDEIKNGIEKEWQGRTWLINNEIIVNLKFIDRLYITLGLVKNN